MSETMYEKLLGKLQKGDVSTSSTWKVRDESAQSRIRIRTITKLERKYKEKYRLLFPTELAFPFNPLTAEIGEFSAANKFRPIMSATSLALTVKLAASQNEDVYNLLLENSGLKEWDFSQPNVLTDQDWKVFRPYRVPRIFTLPVVSIRNKTVTGNKYASNYIVDVNRNELGEVVGEEPKVLRINKLLRELAYLEAEDIKKCVEDARANKPYQLKVVREAFGGYNLATITDDKLKELLKNEVYSQIMVSEDYPANYLMCHQLPLASNMTMKDSYAEVTADDFGKTLRLFRRNKKIGEVIDNYMNGTLALVDTNFDFFEVDMTCPNEETPGMEEAADLGQNSTYSAPIARLAMSPDLGKVTELFRSYSDSQDQLEERFMVSARVRRYNSSLEKKILAVLEDDKLIESPFVNDDFLIANSELLTEIYGNDAMLEIVAAESGLSDNDNSTVLDSEAARKQAKEYNVDDILSEDLEVSAPELIELDAGADLIDAAASATMTSN